MGPYGARLGPYDWLQSDGRSGDAIAHIVEIGKRVHDCAPTAGNRVRRYRFRKPSAGRAKPVIAVVARNTRPERG